MTLGPVEARMFQVGRTARASRASPAPWMPTRAPLDDAIGFVYVRVLAEGDLLRKGPGAGIGLMAASTIFEYS